MHFNRLLSFYLRVVRGTKEPPNLWGCWGDSGELVLGPWYSASHSQKKATMAGEYPDQARILQLPSQGLRACCLILLEVPMKCQDTEKEVNLSEKGSGFADLGQWMGPFWRRAGSHFSNYIFQLRMYFRRDPNFPREHTDFQKRAL